MKKLLSIALIALVSITACKKPEKGDTGPAGTAGNANVKNYTFTTSSADWSLSGSYWYAYYYPTSMSIDAAVMVYWSTNGTDYVALPITVSDMEVYFKINSYHVELDVRSASGNTSVSNPGFAYFKVVVIPPAIKTANPNVNYNSYQEVKRAFNLN